MENTISSGINLAKDRGESLTDRILVFALTIGRLLIIITEAVALGAFLFRFGLDRQILDLHDKISQEQAIVKLLQKNEADYRNLQDRLSLEKSIDSNTIASVKLFQDFANMIPKDMTTTLFSFSGNSLQIEGSLSSLTSLSAYVATLKNNSAVDRVSLNKLEDQTTSGNITISLTVYLKPTVLKPLL